MRAVLSLNQRDDGSIGPSPLYSLALIFCTCRYCLLVFGLDTRKESLREVVLFELCGFIGLPVFSNKVMLDLVVCIAIARGKFDQLDCFIHRICIVGLFRAPINRLSDLIRQNLSVHNHASCLVPTGCLHPSSDK